MSDSVMPHRTPEPGPQVIAPLHSSKTAARLAGVTTRQIDYWARTRIVHPTQQARGQGTRRGWSEDDVRVVRAVGRVAAAFGSSVCGDVLYKVASAARLAGPDSRVTVSVSEFTTITVRMEPPESKDAA